MVRVKVRVKVNLNVKKRVRVEGRASAGFAGEPELEGGGRVKQRGAEFLTADFTASVDAVGRRGAQRVMSAAVRSACWRSPLREPEMSRIATGLLATAALRLRSAARETLR